VKRVWQIGICSVSLASLGDPLSARDRVRHEGLLADTIWHRLPVTVCKMGAVRDLVERPVTFKYGYNMSCPGCSGTTTLTSAEYHSERNGAHVQCAHCGGGIHFGPAVMALRDANDPVLDDQRAGRVAWYHTSTDPGWPSSNHLMPPLAVDLLTGMMPSADVSRARHAYENKALHLGTYETAIEAMLRRMRDEDDGGAQFCLYRVAVRRRALIIERGCRDENSAEASQITQSALGKADAIRHLNVRESPGSISLAVRRDAIGSVQHVSLPVRVVGVTVASSLLREVVQIRAQIDRIESTRSADLDPLERLRQRADSRRDVPFAQSPTPVQSALLDRIGQLIADEYLAGVSRPVRADFAAALHAWRSAQEAAVDDVAYISRFASMARTLTHPEEILRALNEQAAREL
jgi:hypothetical protein